LLLKLGGYGFIRILVNFLPIGGKFFLPMIITMSMLSVIYSSFISTVQKDLKKLIAYSSISHMNFLVMGIFSNTIYGLQGGISLMLAHGLVSSGLFCAIGILYDRYHTRQLEYFSGLVQGMPIYSSFLFLLMLGNSGFPGTYNFISEFIVLISFAHLNFLVLFLSSIGIFFSIVYSMMPYNRIVFGNTKIFIESQKDLNLFEFYSLSILIFYVFVFGFIPNILLDITYTTLKYLILKNDLF